MKKQKNNLVHKYSMKINTHKVFRNKKLDYSRKVKHPNRSDAPPLSTCPRLDPADPVG